MMSDLTTILALAALLFLIMGVYHVGRAWQLRQIEVLSRDQTRLASTRLGLSGRPDRLIRLRNGMVIPEEMKSAERLHDNHRLQIGAYLLLVEDTYRMRPPYGVVALGNGTRIKIRNTASLRQRTLETADQLRAGRLDLSRPARVSPTPGQCRSCGFRDHCEQRAA